jgi:hypothetical protein
MRGLEAARLGQHLHRRSTRGPRPGDRCAGRASGGSCGRRPAVSHTRRCGSRVPPCHCSWHRRPHGRWAKSRRSREFHAPERVACPTPGRRARLASAGRARRVTAWRPRDAGRGAEPRRAAAREGLDVENRQALVAARHEIRQPPPVGRKLRPEGIPHKSQRARAVGSRDPDRRGAPAAPLERERDLPVHARPRAARRERNQRKQRERATRR